MNPRYLPARSSVPFLMAANEGQAPDAVLLGDFQYLCDFGMDRAIAIQKVSLSTFFSLNSFAVDIYKNALWSTPGFGNLLDMTSQALDFTMELQMNWLTMLAPHALWHITTPRSLVASTSGRQNEPAADELAYSMDIAIGPDVASPVSTGPSSSENQARPAEKENIAKFAIGAQAA